MTIKRLLLLSLIGWSLLSACSQDKEVEIRIIHTTDVHGNLFTQDYINGTPMTGGMARLSTLMKEVRQQSPQALLLDGGDILQGEPITYYSNYIDTLKPNAVAVAMNYLKYDAATIGNHDVEPGHQTYDKFVQDATFPLLGANVINTKTGQPYFSPYKIFEQDGIRTLVIGFTTPAIPQWLPEHLWSGMRFDDVVESAKVWIPKLLKDEKPDVLIAMLHSGLVNDNEDYLENAGEVLAQEVSGIDLILLGHDHRQANKWIKRSPTDSVLLLNPANHLDWASDIRIKVKKTRDGQIKKQISASFADVNQYEADPEYSKALESYEQGVISFLGRKIGTLSDSVRAIDALRGASLYLNVVHQMQLYTAKADISFAAPLSIKTEIPSGDIYVRDLFKWCPFSNYLYTMELTGAEIKGYLEHSYGGWAAQMTSPESRLIAMCPDAKAGDKYKTLIPTYNFSSAYGLDYTVDVTKPAGKRVAITQLSNGQAFDLKKTYRVAVNSYRAGGAGGMLTVGAGIPKEALKGRIVAASQYDQFFSLLKYFEHEGTVKPSQATNWQFVPSAWVDQAAPRDIRFILDVK